MMSHIDDLDLATLPKTLRSLADKDYRKFSQKLIPTKKEILGVRLPILQNLAKRIIKTDWQKALTYLTDKTHEEIMLSGFIIAQLPLTWEEKQLLIKNFLPKIDNWAIIDSFISHCKFTEKELDKVWNFLQELLSSSEEFTLRFVLVTLLTYFLKPVFLSNIWLIIEKIKHPGFYVKTAKAWLLATALAKAEKTTFIYLQKSSLEKETFNLALQKAIESKRIKSSLKIKLRAMKRK